MFCPYFVGRPVWLVCYNHSHCQEKVKTLERHQRDCCCCYLHCYCDDCPVGTSRHQKDFHLGDLLSLMVVGASAGDHHQNTKSKGLTYLKRKLTWIDLSSHNLNHYFQSWMFTFNTICKIENKQFYVQIHYDGNLS